MFALSRGFANGSIFPATNVESTILGTMLARLFVIAAVPRFRKSSAGALNILSVEVLLLPVLVLFSYLTGDPLFLQLIRGIFFAWPATFMLVSPLYTIPKLIRRISAGGNLSTVIPTMTTLLALLTFLDLGLSRGTPGVGLSSVTQSALLSAVAVPSATIPWESIATGILAYGAMMFFSLRRESGRLIADSILAVASAGVVVTLLWGIVGSYFTASAQIIFGAPALVLLGLIWGVSRGH